jgi:4-amino-4-deoxy-L-arabinose transferase-like glycosyltransferase
MTQDAAGALPKRTLLEKAGWSALIAATLYVCYFSNLGAIGFVGPDEPRYAWIARAMAETGDWVTPRLYGKPWFEKPPLYYWGAALSFKLFGVSEAAARLSSAICALLATLAMAWLAWRVYGAETARWLLLLLPTTVGMIGFSHAAATDMPFSGMLTIAMVFAAAVLGLTRNEKSSVVPKTPWAALLLFGTFLGLAVLAKGPAAIILSGGAVFFWAVFTKRWKDAFRLLHPAAIASFCGTALPWYILCARRNPDFFRVFIIEHNFKRFLTPEFQHIQPFWYYGPIVLIAVFPWTLLLPALLRDLGRARTANSIYARPNSLYFLVWFAFTVLFFTVSKSKLPGYILPGIPPFVLLMTKSVVERIAGTAGKVRWIGVLCGTGLIALGAAIALLSDRLPLAVDYFPPQPLGWIFLLLIATGLLAVALGVLRRPAITLIVAVMAIVISVGWSLRGDTRWALNSGITVDLTGMTSSEIASRFSGTPVYVYRLPRSFVYSLNFYFHRELREWTPGIEEPAQVFTRSANLREMRQLGMHCPAYMAYPAVIVCRSASPDGSTGGRKLQ